MFKVHEVMPIRTYTGENWFTNSSNKKRLVVDFKNKCGYCGDFDIYSGGYNVYHVEHFAPKEKFKSLEFTYDNLLYSCPYCNIAKSNKWIGSTAEETIVGDKGFVDPCTEEYDVHLGRDELGNIVHKTALGKYMHRELKLYLKRHNIIFNLERVRVKRKAIKEEIDKRKIEKKDYQELEFVYNELGSLFSNYYDLIVEDSEVYA